MSGYDYGNARLRVMKSRLLTRRQLDALVETGSLKGLISELTKTAYSKPVEAALTRATEMDCVNDALRQDVINTLGKVRNFFDGQAGEMVAIPMRTFDIQNLKTIFRGLSKQATTGEIISTLLPIGELEDAVLVELASAPSPRAAIDMLASLGFSFAHPLIKLRGEHPGAGIPEMELALDQWYFKHTYGYLQGKRHAGNVLFFAVKLEADLINLLTILRFVHAPGERNFLSEWFHTDQLDHLFVGPGNLTLVILARAGNQITVNAAVETLENTPYEIPLKTGLQAYAQTALLSDIEKQLKRFRLVWMSKQISKDPLGIGVLLGYLALKINEVGNIRWIAQGVSLGLKPEAIREELEYPA